MKKRINKNLTCAKYMPPLRHSVQGQSFDVRKSRVVMWLISQPDILQYIFDKVHDSGAIDYDKETGTWAGVEYGEDE